MAIEKATVQVTHAKGNIFGETGSGKTVTAILLAIYLSKTYHKNAPIVMWSSEPGVDYVIPICEAEGVELLVEREKTFNAMVNAATEAEKKYGACVFVPDSVTHSWRDLVDSFCKKRKISKPEFQHWGEIKGPEHWGQWTDLFINSKINMFTCGRAGYEYDYELDEEGKQQLIKGDSKMKAEGEFGYEADLLIEMTHSTDKVEKRREMIRSRKTRGKALADDGKNPIGMHFALIKKSRIWSLNDQLFSFKNQREYKPGYYLEVGAPFKPYFDWLEGNRKKLDAAGNTRSVVSGGMNSQSRFSGDQFDSKAYKRKILFEEFSAIMAELFNNRTSKGSHANLVVGRLITNQTSVAAFKAMPTEEVEHCVALVKKFAQNFTEGKLSADTASDDDLKMIVDLSREEIAFEARMNDTPEPSEEAKASSAAMQDTESAVF